MGTEDTPGDQRTEQTAALVERAVAGDERAFGELYDAWFDRVHDLAYGVVRDRSVAAEVAQDAFLRAWQRLDSLRDPSVFGGWLLRIARNLALNRRRSELRSTAVDAESMAMIEGGGSSPVNAPVGFRVEDRMGSADDPAAAVADDEIVALVHDAVDALDGRDAEVLHLGLRYGMAPAEIGEAVGLSRNAANQAVHRARRRLRSAVEARVLWRRGAPVCADLAAALTAAGVARFDATAVAVTDHHAAGCARCQERRRLRLDPAALFGAVPLVAAPSLLKSQVAHALSAQGVPMRGSFHAGTAGAPAATDRGWDDPSGRDDPTVAELRPTEGPPGEVSSPPGVWGRRLLAAVAAVAIIVVGVVALAESAGDPGAPDASATASSAFGGPTRGTSEVVTTTMPADVPGLAPTSAPPAAPVTTMGPRVIPPPSEPPAPPTAPPSAPPVAATGSISVTPSTTTRPWPMSSGAPVLSWVTERVASVSVTGPGVSRTDRSGSVLLCPPSGTTGSVCGTPVGTYTYALTARDASGAVLFIREARLVVVA